MPYRPPTKKLTAHQYFYIFIIDGIGAAILSGAINFGIAYLMYIYSLEKDEPVNLFQFPNTLAGDAALTIILQCIITWLIELLLVNGDLKEGRVQPIGVVTEPRSRWLRWYLFLDIKQDDERSGVADWSRFFISQVLRAFLLSIPSFVLLWGPSVGIMTAFGNRDGGDWTYHNAANQWVPVVFKGVLGGVLGFITTPIITVFWLMRAGWAVQYGEEKYGQK
ncbi:uncharacterized protein BCR38DRAFT_347229 [Pseudomassariella vexata]|uniref:Uncharacterized protein n=1 Tax=Pseudomassariella vexata TaxID=1141098 RepID=A0A1Y2DQZ4_9PEZI|nr:uncharacterized protein BCR38DRAFT_347229 [Pseudomassariella vexata]ORY61690.1 hypothetical protein BCR38DRAFT_347229 [Pseudomassariella vexata]